MQAFAVGEMQALVHNSSDNTGQSLTELFDNGNRTPKASELVDWAADQGWTQRPGPGPRTFVDQNGRVRLKIKVAVQSPGSTPIAKFRMSRPLMRQDSVLTHILGCQLANVSPETTGQLISIWIRTDERGVDHGKRQGA